MKNKAMDERAVVVAPAFRERRILRRVVRLGFATLRTFMF